MIGVRAFVVRAVHLVGAVSPVRYARMIRAVLLLAVLVVLLLWLCTPRDGRLFRRWHAGERQHYWSKAGGWELFGLGVLLALFVAFRG